MSDYQEQEKNFISIDISVSLDGLTNLIDHIEAEGDKFGQLEELKGKLSAFHMLFLDIDDPSMKCVITDLKRSADEHKTYY